MFPKLQKKIESGMSLLMSPKYEKKIISEIAKHNIAIRYCHLIDTLFYRQKGVPEPICTGMEQLEDALKFNKGVIILVPHYGCFGSVAYTLFCRGYKFHQLLTLYPQNIYRKINVIDSAVVRAKARCWSHPDVINIYYRPGHYMRQIYRVLKENGILIMYADGSRGEKFDLFDFMGSKIRFSTGPAEIAARTGAALLPAFSITDDGLHRITIESPLFVKGKDAIRESTLAYVKLLERYVETYPGQWHTWMRLSKMKEGIIEPSVRSVQFDEFYSPADTK